MSDETSASIVVEMPSSLVTRKVTSPGQFIAAALAAMHQRLGFLVYGIPRCVRMFSETTVRVAPESGVHKKWNASPWSPASHKPKCGVGTLMALSMLRRACESMLGVPAYGKKAPCWAGVCPARRKSSAPHRLRRLHRLCVLLLVLLRLLLRRLPLLLRHGASARPTLRLPRRVLDAHGRDVPPLSYSGSTSPASSGNPSTRAGRGAPRSACTCRPGLGGTSPPQVRSSGPVPLFCWAAKALDGELCDVSCVFEAPVLSYDWPILSRFSGVGFSSLSISLRISPSGTPMIKANAMKSPASIPLTSAAPEYSCILA